MEPEQREAQRREVRAWVADLPDIAREFVPGFLWRFVWIGTPALADAFGLLDILGVGPLSGAMTVLLWVLTASFAAMLVYHDARRAANDRLAIAEGFSDRARTTYNVERLRDRARIVAGQTSITCSAKVIDQEVRLFVRNDGDTDDFVAEIFAFGGRHSVKLPQWDRSALRWGYCGSRAATIMRGATDYVGIASFEVTQDRPDAKPHYHYMRLKADWFRHELVGKNILSQRYNRLFLPRAMGITFGVLVTMSKARAPEYVGVSVDVIPPWAPEDAPPPERRQRFHPRAAAMVFDITAAGERTSRVTPSETDTKAGDDPPSGSGDRET